MRHAREKNTIIFHFISFIHCLYQFDGMLISFRKLRMHIFLMVQLQWNVMLQTEIINVMAQNLVEEISKIVNVTEYSSGN